MRLLLIQWHMSLFSYAVRVLDSRVYTQRMSRIEFKALTHTRKYWLIHSINEHAVVIMGKWKSDVCYSRVSVYNRNSKYEVEIPFVKERMNITNIGFSLS